MQSMMFSVWFTFNLDITGIINNNDETAINKFLNLLVKQGQMIITLLLTERASVAASKQRKTKQALIPETLK